MPNLVATHIRLDPDLKARAVVAAQSAGIPLARWIENAIAAALGEPAPGPAPDTAAMLSRLSDIEARLLEVENAIAAIPPPVPYNPHPAPHPAPPPDTAQIPLATEGLSQRQAMVRAGYPGNVTNARRDLAKLGDDPEQWLRDRGWVQRGAKWYPMSGE